MSHQFWKGLSPISVRSPNILPHKIVKLCAIGTKLIGLGSDHGIYTCDTDTTELNFIKVSGFVAVDLSLHSEILYYIDLHGRLFKTNINFESKEEIVVKEDPKCCSHGFKSSAYKVKFRNVVANDFGQLFISRDGQLWGSGKMSQIGLDSPSIKKIPFFEGRIVYSASLGDNFAAVIARKKVHESDIFETDSENEEDVFVSNCSQCQAIIGLASPVSVTSLSETCPLGLQVSKSSEDSSSTTAPQTDIQIDEHSLTEDSSPSSDTSKIVKINDSDENNSDLKFDSLSNKICENNNEDKTDSEKLHDSPEKVQNIFMNADAARQFLSKQLSWVSVGEDYLVEYTEKPTRIIKENVSNLTNLVYEGVKTVGDKVATLSRHVSGSSDTNEILELENQLQCEEVNGLMYTYTSNCKLNDLHISSSTISSEKDFEIIKRNENIKYLSKVGKNILATELWTWGDVSHGQLGVGDTVKRVRPMIVMSLSGLGLQKVSCGKLHCSALTLDGRLFLWGYNSYHQVTFESREDKSGPKQFTENSDSDRIRDIISTDHHTIAYTHNENILYMGKHCDGFTDKIINLNKKGILLKEASHVLEKQCGENFTDKLQNLYYHWRILSSDDIVYCAVENSMNSKFQDLSIAQRYLEEMLLISNSIIKPFLKKTKAITVYAEVYETVCEIFSDILNFTAINVLSMWQFTEKHIKDCDITLIKNLDEFIYLYKKYYLAINNLIVIGGFAQINNIVDVPTNIYNLFIDQLPSNKPKNNKKTSEAIVSLALIQPLTRLSSYKCMTQSLLRNKIKDQLLSHNDDTNDKLSKVIISLETLIEEQEKTRKEAEITKLFWETVGKSLEQHRIPQRRLIRESKSKPLNLLNPGRFTSHWFILFNDLLVHISGSNTNVHQLETLWVEAVINGDSTHNVIQLITPEEIILVTANSEQDKIEWINALNTEIKSLLKKNYSHKPPSVRTASYIFSNKSVYFKEAKYHGRWFDGKLHGSGKLEWPDNKIYFGQFQMGALCGYGKMDIPGVGIYEGYWKDNLQNGYGVLKYSNGDIYEGYFKDGVPHGHGIQKQGDFTSSSAAIYTGEWVNGVKQGYGVMDDIGKGEKYLGNWSDNRKHGCGLIVTLDGIYYEGVFMQDNLMGHGVMVFEDGTNYEGEFRAAGVFSGKGVLTFSSGDKIEGSLSGPWTEGVKISNATLQLNVSNPALPVNSKPSSFGKLCVTPNQKWNALFRQCFQSLGVPETLLTPTGSHFANSSIGHVLDNKKIWHNVAVAMSSSHKAKRIKSRETNNMGSDIEKSIDCLEVIPQFGQKTLNLEDYMELKKYLQNACESTHHPLGQLFLGLTKGFNTTYGGVRVHPLLLSHAVSELKSITTRLYQVVRLLFPALPIEGTDLVLPYKTQIRDERDDEVAEETNPIFGEVVSDMSLLQPLLLPRAHPALFVLYALHNKREDDLYWRRLLKWNRQPDITLMAFLGIDQKFWAGNNNHQSPTHAPLQKHMFHESIETLQQLKTTFSPIEKLLVIRRTFEKMTFAVQQKLGQSYLWGMDELFPVFHFVVVRAQILQLGSEIHFVEDFLDPAMQRGELGLMFTTLKLKYSSIGILLFGGRISDNAVVPTQAKSCKEFYHQPAIFKYYRRR